MSLTKQTTKQTHKQTMSSTQIQQLEARIVMLEQLVRAQLVAAAPMVVDKSTKKAKKAKSDGPTLNKDGSERKKRITSGYQVYSNSLRVQVRTELEKDGSVKVKPSEVVSELARRWKAMSADEQQIWKDEAVEVDAALVAAPAPSDEGSDVELEDNSSDED